MSGPRLVGGGPESGEPLAALADGRVIALAVDGGYLLAARPGHRRRCAARARAVDSPRAGPLAAHGGSRAQAMAQASEWTKETRILTDRMWPGPA